MNKKQKQDDVCENCGFKKKNHPTLFMGMECIQFKPKQKQEVGG